MTQIEPIFADLFEVNLALEMSPVDFAELWFDGTPITQIEPIFADLFIENLTLEMSPADFAEL
jgi:hypothetical protein